jgi:hypothetical protein
MPDRKMKYQIDDNITPDEAECVHPIVASLYNNVDVYHISVPISSWLCMNAYMAWRTQGLVRTKRSYWVSGTNTDPIVKLITCSKFNYKEKIE